MLLLLGVGCSEYFHRGILVKSKGFVYAQLHTYILLGSGKIRHEIVLSLQPNEDQRKELELDKMIT